MRWRAIAMLTVAGCGRFGFGSHDRADASVDAVVDAGPRPCPSFAVFCDDFETGDVSHWSGLQRSVPEAQLNVSTARAASGMYSLDAEMLATQFYGESGAVQHDYAVEASGMLALRTWVYPINLADFSGVLYIGGTGHYVVTGVTNVLVWNMSEDGPASALTDHNAIRVLERDRWQCLETDVDMTAHTAQVFIDETKILDVALADPTPQYQNIVVGLPTAAAAGAHVFVDDVALAHQHVGCE